MKTTQEIAEIIIQMTDEFSQVYFDEFKKKKLDKQLWAALHIGFITGMKQNGYKEENLVAALEIAQTFLGQQNEL